MTGLSLEGISAEIELSASIRTERVERHGQSAKIDRLFPAEIDRCQVSKDQSAVCSAHLSIVNFITDNQTQRVQMRMTISIG